MRVFVGALCSFLLLSVLTGASRADQPPPISLESFQSGAAFFKAWKIKKWRGVVGLDFLRDGDRDSVRLTADASSWAFLRAADGVDLSRTPVASWSWKVLALAAGGDGRRRETDDQTAALYVFFPGTGPLGKWDCRIVGYTWETAVPKGTYYTSPKNEKTKIFVLRDGADPAGQWFSERRNVAEDFRKAFGVLDVPAPQAVCFQIDSDDTHSKASSAFGPILFEAAP